LGALHGLQDWEEIGSIKPKDTPELERYVLHMLWELDQEIKAAYKVYDYKKVTAALTHFMTSDLSAFYFDIRKDALYCDPWSSMKRRATRAVIDQLFRCLVTWWAPILVFTAEETWLSRFPGEGSSVHLMQFGEAPADWRDDELAKKWTVIRNVRRAVTGALEIERANKTIGSSLEASPTVYVEMEEWAVAAVKSVDFAEICITSGLTWGESAAPADAFRADDLKNVAVVFAKAEGAKCARSWKISKDIGTDKDFPDITPRDADAVREWQKRNGKMV
jgi:isoleucyl-tRNA synthetase